MKLTLFALTQTIAAIAAVAVGVHGIPMNNMSNELKRNPKQYFFGNGRHSRSVDEGRTWIELGRLDQHNAPSGTMWEFLKNTSELHLFRDGRHLMSNNQGASWNFLGCEANPFARRDEQEQGKGLGMPYVEDIGDDAQQYVYGGCTRNMRQLGCLRPQVTDRRDHCFALDI
ncbi:hypothetical protein THASP1DRAFT_23329 [Thamnocephalis sphaerospora]|uniref:Uncharacterized protein n=1 Tax=Thamnocephalis sphaerospora TaxID=78915 RepID=A0A4P9XTH0_9FUNG|nr:hypothetical protein THASP1DRAFT_23329 [Thamnocephalis sphaerospora]|eukprot:RKP08730.1 hypothetical protein THASP1DRAFT_23329 [Thamnocephalis sphaerospora]